jgi:hypothetical protein
MKDPAVLFYTQDFLTGTFLMTNEQVGKYIRLLCLQQQNGGLNECDMLQICGEKDEKIWAKFDFIDGHYFNKRMTLETTKRRKFIESRQKNLSHTDDHMDSHMEICNKKEEISNKKEEKEIVFKSEVFEFLDKYPEAMLNKFCNYWTEKNPSKTKMRYELQKTFEISRRLVTWANNDKEFNKIEKAPELISYKELVDRFNKGENTMWEKYEQVTPGDSKSMWKLKKV